MEQGECSSIYSHNKSKAFPLPIFTKLKDAEERVVQVLTPALTKTGR
jgi:hypothetical protein